MSIFIFGFLPSVPIHQGPTQGNFSYFHRSHGTLVQFSVFWDDVYLWIMICQILCQGRPITFQGVQRQTSAAWLNSLEYMADPRTLSNHLATTYWECLIGEEVCKKLPLVCCKTWFLMQRPYTAVFLWLALCHHGLNVEVEYWKDFFLANQSFVQKKHSGKTCQYPAMDFEVWDLQFDYKEARWLLMETNGKDSYTRGSAHRFWQQTKFLIHVSTLKKKMKKIK